MFAIIQLYKLGTNLKVVKLRENGVAFIGLPYLCSQLDHFIMQGSVFFLDLFRGFPLFENYLSEVCDILCLWKCSVYGSELSFSVNAFMV